MGHRLSFLRRNVPRRERAQVQRTFEVRRTWRGFLRHWRDGSSLASDRLSFSLTCIILCSGRRPPMAQELLEQVGQVRAYMDRAHQMLQSAVR